MAFNKNMFCGWKEPTTVYPKLTPEQMTNTVKESNQPKLMLTWREGAVLLHRGDKLVKEITEFNPVGIKDTSTVKPKNTWCWEGAFRDITDLQGKNLDSTLPFRADRGKYYTYHTGIRPVKFLEMYNACMMKAFIPQDLRDEANKYCRERLGRFNKNSVKILIERADDFRQMREDGMSHVVPFFINVQAKSGEALSVSDMRKRLGKSTWKSILKNSSSRNRLVAHSIHNTNYSGWNYSTDYKTIVEHVNKLPTGMIPRNSLQEIPDVESVPLFRRLRIVSNPLKQGRISQYIRDSKRMAEQLGRKIPKGNSSWSFDQWKDYHEKVTELVNLKKYSRDTFKWTKPYTQSFKSENYSASILNNAFDIKMEGEVMKHCVASYSGRSNEGKYMVVSVLDSSGERHSTLGLYVNEKGITYNQHYKNCNASVQEDEVKEFAKTIVKTLNKEYHVINGTKGENDE